MLIVDAIVLTTVVIVFQDVRTAMYTLFFILIDTLVIDLIGEGGFAGKGFLIVTSKPEEIAKRFLTIWVAGLPLSVEWAITAVKIWISSTVSFHGMR